MIVSDCTKLIRNRLSTQGGSGSRWPDSQLIPEVDEAIKLLVAELYFPQSRLVWANLPAQQEYPLPELHRIDRVYLNGVRIVEKVGDIDTLEGRQIQFDDNTGQGVAEVPTAATGFTLVVGPFTPGDILTTVVGGHSAAYTVLSTDTTALILATSIATQLNATAAIAALVTAQASQSTFGEVDLIAKTPGLAGNSITLSVSSSGGATETYTSSGGFQYGSDNGAGAAPGTSGGGVPAWSIQTPLSAPFLLAQGIPSSTNAPWALNGAQRACFYRRGGSIGLVPPPIANGSTLVIDCVRVPNTLANPTDQIVVPSNFKTAIVYGTLKACFLADGSDTSLAKADKADREYNKAVSDLRTWMRQYGLADPTPQPSPAFRQQFQFGLNRTGVSGPWGNQW